MKEALVGLVSQIIYTIFRSTLRGMAWLTKQFLHMTRLGVLRVRDALRK